MSKPRLGRQHWIVSATRFTYHRICDMSLMTIDFLVVLGFLTLFVVSRMHFSMGK